jgi:hypothetical protein
MNLTAHSMVWWCCCLGVQAKAMRSHMEEQRRAVTLLEGEHRTALARAKALMDAYKRAKDQAEEEHPLDAAAKKAFTELSDDRWAPGTK